MKNGASYTKKLLRISCLYALLFLILLTLSVWIVKKRNEPVTNTLITETVRTEYVYVERDTSSGDDQIYYEDEEQVYTIRAHMGRIGIFLSDGTLKEIIEVYVNTLPIADRRQLEEGFEVVGKQRLYSIIEDYSV